MDLYRKWKSALLCSYLVLAILCSLLPSTTALKRFNEACDIDTECSTEFCHPHKKTCDCGVVKDYYSGKKLEQFYDNDLGMCLSRIGQICSLEVAKHNGLTPLRCIPDAICSVMSKHQLPGKPSYQLFGSCGCKLGFQPTKNGLRCISNVEIRAEQAPSTMDQKQEGWSSGSCSNILPGRQYIACISTFVIILFGVFPFR